MTSMPNDAIIIHDGHIILECNDAFCELFQCEREALVDMQVELIIHGDDLRALAVWRGKHIMKEPEEKEYKQNYTFFRCDGSTFWGESTSKRIGPDRYETRIKWHYDDRRE